MRTQLRNVDFKNGPYDGVDCAVIITEWDEFRALDLDRVREVMNRPLVVDLRNIYRPDEMRSRGFTYLSVGRREGQSDAEKFGSGAAATPSLS
jgi:UDPglucose 6-dehydrogenase